MSAWSSSTDSKISVYSHPDYVYCDETKEWLHKDSVMSIKGIGTRKIKHGKWGLKYVSFQYQGFTKVLCFTKKSGKTEYLFNEDATQKEIEESLFRRVDHYEFFTLAGKTKRLYRATYKYTTIPYNEWKEKYNSNLCLTRYKSKDSALISLSDIMKDVSGCEIQTSTPCKALAQARDSIEIIRHGLVFVPDENFPCMEVLAIWLNFDPETGYVNLGDYDKAEPSFYEHRIINSKKDLEKHDN